MSTVSQVLARKGREVHTIGPSNTVFDAIGSMVAYNIGSLVVVDHASPCGIITERDYLRKVVILGRASKTTLVDAIMSTPVVYVEPSTSVDDCMHVMTRDRIRHLPVICDGELVGLVSIGDIVKCLADERMEEICELTAYIQGTQKWRMLRGYAA
jgi:CBS domain-containing protein